MGSQGGNRIVHAPTPPSGGPATAPAGASAPSALVLVNLDEGDSFIFRLFPAEIGVTGRANWEPQRVARRPSPLFYGGREPQELTFNVWLDNSHTGDSVNDELVQLLALQDVRPGKGAPPALLARWGSCTFRGVLSQVQITQKFFTREGNPLRAELSLTLLELQDDAAQQAAPPPAAPPAAPPRQTTPLTGQVTTGGKGPQL